MGGIYREFTVVETNPRGPVLINAGTSVKIKGESVSQPGREATGVTYEDIGGLRKQVQRIREMIELPLRYPELFDRLGIEPPKGVLLYGPPGTGKTLIAKALANETSAYFTHIGGPEVMGKYYGESEERLRKIFEEAQEHAPAILFIDEIDAVAPKREELGSQQQVEKRVVAQLLSLMDGLKSRGQVAIIGATNAPQLIDPALRRPGRFDREINVGVPERNGRREILEVHTRGMPLAEDVSARQAGRDHARLRRRRPCRPLPRGRHGHAAQDLRGHPAGRRVHPLRPADPPRSLHGRLPRSADRGRAVRPARGVHRSAGRTLGRRRRPGGREGDPQADHRVAAAVRRPVRARRHVAAQGRAAHRHPAAPARRCMAKAVAHECGVNFISVKGPELLSKWVGDSERAHPRRLQDRPALQPLHHLLRRARGDRRRRRGGAREAPTSPSA